MTTTHHLESLPDRAATDSMRAMVLPMKGSVDGPSAREPFDHLMESTPAAPGVVVGEDDILLDDSIRYAERLEGEGGTVHLHTWAGMMHVFPSNLALLQAANEALSNIGDFLKQQLSGDDARRYR